MPENVDQSLISEGEKVLRLVRSSQLDGFVAGLTGDFDQDATVALARLFERAGGDHRDTAGHVHLPRGQYRRTAPLRLKNGVHLSGDGPRATKLQSAVGAEFPYSILVNDDPAGANFQLVSNLLLSGGRSGYRVDATGGTTDLHFDKVDFGQQAVAGLEIERLFQVVALSDCNFGRCGRGIWVKNATSNAVYILGGSFTDLPEAALDLNGVEALICIGTRFEGGGRAGFFTLDLQNVRVATFLSCHFENTHEYLLRARRTGSVGPALSTPGVITFQGCHFTFGPGGAPYRWQVDGAITFRDCNSGVPMRIPSQAVLEGHNRNFAACTRAGRLVSTQIAARAHNKLLTVKLDDHAGSFENLNLLTGELLVSFIGMGSGGGGFARFSRRYHVSCWSVPAGTEIGADIKLISDSDLTTGPKLAVNYAISGPDIILYAEISGVTPDDPCCVLGWTFTWDQVAGQSENLFAVALA